MCRVPDPEDAKYKDDEDAYEDDLEEMQTKTKPREADEAEDAAEVADDGVGCVDVAVDSDFDFERLIKLNEFLVLLPLRP